MRTRGETEKEWLDDVIEARTRNILRKHGIDTRARLPKFATEPWSDAVKGGNRAIPLGRKSWKYIAQALGVPASEMVNWRQKCVARWSGQKEKARMRRAATRRTVPAALVRALVDALPRCIQGGGVSYDVYDGEHEDGCVNVGREPTCSCKDGWAYHSAGHCDHPATCTDDYDRDEVASYVCDVHLIGWDARNVSGHKKDPAWNCGVRELPYANALRAVLAALEGLSPTMPSVPPSLHLLHLLHTDVKDLMAHRRRCDLPDCNEPATWTACGGEEHYCDEHHPHPANASEMADAGTLRKVRNVLAALEGGE